MRINRFISESRFILRALPDVLVSWKTFFWTFPVAVLSTTYITPVSINSVDDFFKWVFIAFMGHIAMIPFVIYGQDKKNPREQLLLVVLMGITRGSIVGLIIPLMSVNDPLPIYFRILNSTVGIFYWFIVGSILVQFMLDFRQDLKKLVEESVLSDATLELPEHYVDSNILLARVSALQRDITATIKGTPTREKLNQRAAEIDRLVRVHIRPLSHSEWREGEFVWMKAGFLRIVTETLRQRPLPFWGIALLTLPYSLIGQVYRFGIVRTLITSFLWIAIAATMRSVVIRKVPFRDRNYLNQNLIFILGVFLIVLPLIFITHMAWPENTISARNILQLQATRTFSFAVLCAVTSMCIALMDEERAVFRVLTQQIKEKDVKGFLQLGAKAKAEANYAQYLHAEVQSQLLACKLLLLKAAESDFTLFPPEVTQQILERFEKIGQPYERMPARLPSKRVEEVAASWRGLANITHALDPEIDGAEVPHDVVGQLIEESVVNAIRHGKAKNVHIKGFAFTETFSVEVFDDGASETYSKGSGLGTILFDTFTENWSIAREANETVVRFSVARKVAS
jgi:hypothetical protein